MAPQLAVVIPCYNESERLRPLPLLEAARRRPDWYWILVDDGSSDNTASLLDSLVPQLGQARVLRLERNRGKAEAVRQGMLAGLECGASWVGFLDADLATPPAELERMLEAGVTGAKAMVWGCRVLRIGATIRRDALRHYGGRLVAAAISLLLRLPTYDTQCGAKIFRAEILPPILDRPFHSRWLFDVEIAARYRNQHSLEQFLASVLELPLLHWVDPGGSRLKPIDLVRLPQDLWKLHRMYNLEGRHYG